MSNLDDVMAIESLPDHIAKVNDILTAYLDGNPTVEMSKDLADKLSYCVYLCDEGLRDLVEELKEKEPELFESED